MSEADCVVVVGLGEVGRPLLELVSRRHHAIGVDVAPALDDVPRVDVMHVCYPFEVEAFVEETVRYVQRFRPALTVVNSTVAVGTTRAIAARTGAAVVHSPVRGKHARMRDELLAYTKFVGPIDAAAGKDAAAHWEGLGMRTRVLASPEATELAKLAETAYFGLLIAWAQDVERYCDRLGPDYDDVVSFFDEIGFFPPVKYVPGVIGGHCVMPNLEILRRCGPSEILAAIESSNQKKADRKARRARA